MALLLIGYARVSTDEQDVTAQREALAALGVSPDRIYVDHGLTGTNRDRPGLREALAACREGDTLVVTKLDRLARSLPDARDIVDDLTRRRHVRLSLNGSLHDPNDPVGRLLFNVLAMVAEFEATSSGFALAKACASPRPKAAYAASSPSSTHAKKHTSLLCTQPATTASPNSATSSASPAQPSTAPSSATGDASRRSTRTTPPRLPCSDSRC